MATALCCSQREPNGGGREKKKHKNFLFQMNRLWRGDILEGDSTGRGREKIELL